MKYLKRKSDGYLYPYSEIVIKYYPDDFVVVEEGTEGKTEESPMSEEQPIVRKRGRHKVEHDIGIE